jgi:hypothetical protein
MLTKTLLLAPFLLSLVLEGAAAPSPKRPEIKYPKLKRPGHLAKREALETSVLQVSLHYPFYSKTLLTRLGRTPNDGTPHRKSRLLEQISGQHSQMPKQQL